MPKIYTLTETTSEATHYYIIPPLKVAIPKGDQAREVLNAVLQRSKDFNLPGGLADYPIITRRQLHTLFPDCIPYKVKVTYLKYEITTKYDKEPIFTTKQLKLILSLRK